MKRQTLFHATIRGFVLLLGTMSAVAQNSYQQTNLVSDMAGAAAHTDPKLINPWGIALCLVDLSGLPITTVDSQRSTMRTASSSSMF